MLAAGKFRIPKAGSEANSGNAELSEGWGWALKCALYAADFIIAAADRGGWEDTAGPDRGGEEKRVGASGSSAFGDKQEAGASQSGEGKPLYTV